jgi:hypothetical protein
MVTRSSWSRSSLDEPLKPLFASFVPVTENGFSKDWIKALSTALANTPSLQNINLIFPVSVGLHAAISPDLCQELSLGPSLRSFSTDLVGGCDSKLANVLIQSPQLTSLYLFATDPLLKVLHTLPQLTCLKSLVLGVMDPSSFASFISILPQLRLDYLKVFGLQRNHSSSSFFSALASQSETLHSLSLNRCWDLSISNLTRILPEFRSLNMLSLAYCSFQPVLDVDSIRSFVAALHQTEVAYLVLQELIRSAEVLEELVSALPSLTSLRQLELSDCKIGDDSKRAEKIWSDCFVALSKCPKINVFKASSIPPFLCDLPSLLPKTHLTCLDLLGKSALTPEQQKAISNLPTTSPDWRCHVML